MIYSYDTRRHLSLRVSTWWVTCSRLIRSYNRLLVSLSWVSLLHQLWAVVDGRPVQQGDVLLVGLPDVISRFHQLLAALEDPEPAGVTHTNHDEYQTNVQAAQRRWWRSTHLRFIPSVSDNVKRNLQHVDVMWKNSIWYQRRSHGTACTQPDTENSKHHHDGHKTHTRTKPPNMTLLP